MVNVNDGGVAITYDGGKVFKPFYNEIPVVQFFNVNYDMSTPFKVYGSIQDHGSRVGKVDLSNGRNNIPAVEFEYAPGGEGSNHFVDPTNTDIVYSAGFYGTLYRTNVKTNDGKKIMPPTPEGVKKLRGQWIAPFILSPHNPRIVYHGTQFVHRSMDQGETWDKISPDLTYNKDEMKGDIPYQTIFTISESTFQFGMIYAGTDDGRVWITKNHGENWTEITKGLPYRKWVSQIEASKFNKSTVYMTQNGKREDDFTPYIWKSNDYGQTWIDITNNLPIGPVNVIREDPHNQGVLYVGTDYGVYVSLNDGADWISLPGNFPTTYVHDLIIHPRDHIMVAATHGRGLAVASFGPLGIDDPKTVDETFSMAPNPATEFINVKLQLNEPENVQIKIFDQNGRIVADYDEGTQSGYYQKTIGVSHLQAGNYIFKLITPTKALTQKLIIQ